MSDKKWTRRAALGLIGTGAGLFAVETAGFTQIEGVRDVDLDTEEDPDGLVGFVGPDFGEVVSACEGSRVELFSLSTNLVEEASDDEEISDDDEMTIESVEFKSADAELEVHDFDFPDSVGGDAEPVSGVVGLTGGGPATGTATFEIVAKQDDISVTLDREVVIEVGEKVVKPFTEVGTDEWSVPGGLIGDKVDVLVVGGGGGGAANTNFNSAGGGGGGAGGVAFAAGYEIPNDTVNVTVGDGGAGVDNPAPVSGENGEDSTFDDLTAKGGGGGNLTSADGNQSASDGGSGGGGRQNPPGEATQPETNDGAADFGNGGARNDNDDGGGGGGGAGEEPADISRNDGGQGGKGIAEAEIDGEAYNFAELFGTEYGEEDDSNVYFAGGGGGGGDGNGAPGIGGLGGGGDGASDRDDESAEDGTENTGGGGGGGASGPGDDAPGGDGGSGIVLVKYCTTETVAIPALSDLDIADQGDDATIEEEDDEDVTVLASNIGNGAGAFDLDLEVTDSDNDIVVSDDTETNNINPDEDEQVTFEAVTGGLGAGEYGVSVFTDDVTVNGRLFVGFYSNPVNYSDNRERGSGTAPQPDADNAKGVVRSSANIGRDNEDVATIEESEQGGGNVSVRAGFRLRSVGSEDCYTLTIKTADGGGGNLRAYIVNENGKELTKRRRIEGNNDYSFKIDGDEDEDDLDGIGEADSLFLLFQGEGNQSHEIKFIDFEAGCGS